MTMENITLLLAIFYFLKKKRRKEKRLSTCEKGKGSDTMTNSRPMRKFLAYFVRPKMFQEKKKKRRKNERKKKINKRTISSLERRSRRERIKRFSSRTHLLRFLERLKKGRGCCSTFGIGGEGGRRGYRLDFRAALLHSPPCPACRITVQGGCIP